VEVGAKVGLVPPQGVVEADFPVPGWLRLDPQAEYQKSLQIDLDQLPAQVSIPHAVDHVVDLDQVAGQPVNVVFVGTCTNGRYEDLHTVAQALRGKRIAPGVRMVVTPASSRELARAAADGSLGILLEAGATLTTPGCGMCMGRHQGTLGEADVCLSTGNRNFKGRMGSPNAQIYLASPAVAAATALRGMISNLTDL
jgi:methanogen homoaconitase large subunit